MTWFDTGGNKPPFEPPPSHKWAPAPQPDEMVDEDPMPDAVVEYRCEWCYGYLPADGLCRCPGSLRDLEQQRAEMRVEL
jgi:hypothetical protein